MKVVMINDCAHVGETLIKYFPQEIEVRHLKRSRRFLDKTFGIAWKIWKVKGDIYHVHYLLQDCYLALKYRRRPLIGHAHGSDLRSSLRHSLFGRMVRHNLNHCDKILVSTPDILGIARESREDAEYLPNPVDTEIFYPKPVESYEGKKRVLIASNSNWSVKGTDIAVKALSKLKEDVEVSIIRYGMDFDKTAALASSLGLRLNVLPKVSHEKMRRYYWNSDLVIDRFKLGSLGLISLEAIACGRPIVAYVSSDYPEYKDFPLKDVNTEETIADAIHNSRRGLWEKQYGYLGKNHRLNEITERLSRCYAALA